MSHNEIDRATNALEVVLKDVLRFRDAEADRLIEVLKDFARALADDEIDRLFNRGDYRG